MAATCGVLRDHQGVVLAAFGSFLGHQSILFAELTALLEGLDLAVQLGFSDLEVESDSGTMVSWAISSRFVRWDFAYLFGRVQALASSPSIIINHVFSRSYICCWFFGQLGLYSSDLSAIFQSWWPSSWFIGYSSFGYSPNSIHSTLATLIGLVLYWSLNHLLLLGGFVYVPLLMFFHWLIYLQVGVRPNPPPS